MLLGQITLAYERPAKCDHFVKTGYLGYPMGKHMGVHGWGFRRHDLVPERHSKGHGIKDCDASLCNYCFAIFESRIVTRADAS